MTVLYMIHDPVLSPVMFMAKANTTSRSSIHNAKLKRLQQLINHKAKLETIMDTKLQSLKASYDAHSRDVESVLKQRIKELQ